MCWLVLVVCCLSVQAMGGIGEWKSYTSKRQIRDISADQKGYFFVLGRNCRRTAIL